MPDTIYAQPGASFDAFLQGLPSQAARVRIVDTPGTTVLYGPSAAGIAEVPAASGLYYVTLTAPLTRGTYAVQWDYGTATPVATDGLVVSGAAPPVAPTAGALCTLADVRAYLQKPAGDVEQDELLELLIARATAAIHDYTQRELCDQGTLTRRFLVRGRVADLGRRDLRVATAIVLHPESDAPATLAATTGYTLHPPGQTAEGTYRLVKVASDAAVDSDHAARYGYALVDITGQWGAATIPDAVRQACVICVARWFRRDVAATVSVNVGTDEETDAGPESLPIGTRALLTPYRRRPVA